MLMMATMMMYDVNDNDDGNDDYGNDNDDDDRYNSVHLCFFNDLL